MKPSEAIRPISYLKAHAAEIIREISENRNPVYITQHGIAKVVLQDVYSYEQTQESLAMLKLLALSAKDYEEGNYKPVKQAFKDLKKRISEQPSP